MTILVKKNGQLIIDHAQPLEGKDANLDNLAAFIADPADGDAIVFNATKGIWEAGEVSGGGMVVTITASDGNMVMDHTWKEIHDAIPVMPVTVMIDANGTRMQGNVVSVFFVEFAGYGVNAVIYQNHGYTDSQFVTDSEDGYPSAQA